MFREDIEKNMPKQMLAIYDHIDSLEAGESPDYVLLIDLLDNVRLVGQRIIPVRSIDCTGYTPLEKSI